MSNIFQVLSNLNHDGELIVAGRFIEGEAEAFAELVRLGVLKIVEGAESLAHAAELVAAEAKQGAEAAKVAEVAKPANTFGPVKDESKPDMSGMTSDPTNVPAKDSAPAKVAAVPIVGAGDLPPDDDNL